MAQPPTMHSGMGHRTSETSLNSYEQSSSNHGYNRAYGPSAGAGIGGAAAGAAGSRGYAQATSSSYSSTPRYASPANVSPQQTGSPRFSPAETMPLREGVRGGSGPLQGIDESDLDDQLHTFTAADRKDLSTPFDITSWRGWANGLTLFVLMAGFIVLFAGYPIIDWAYNNEASSGGNTPGFNLGGVNASGQVPQMPADFPSMIDPDTPEDVKKRTGFDGEEWTLVFSDEFNKEGRTFYPGDDPFFTAVDIHYWPTNDFEWYDPGQVTTKDGHLLLTIEQIPTNNLMFRSGMIQSWNQLCFSHNAYFEARVSLPGHNDIGGFWPGVWTMGNLGRPGYGGTTEGLWPYSYDSCDVGIMPNQTWLNGTGPEATLTTGQVDDRQGYKGTLSFLPGQKLSKCNCDWDTHPGPKGVGRGSVEIDMIEAQIDLDVGHGEVSQSAQFAPFDDHYQFYNKSGFKIFNEDVTKPNTYLGGVFQQCVSCLSYTHDSIYHDNQVEGRPTADGSSEPFGVFGFEYVADYEHRKDGYVTWVNQGKQSWWMNYDTVQPNKKVGVGQRLIAEEPMALIFNLGMSNNFQNVDFRNMNFPNYMRIDYIRVWQKESGLVGCDPDDRPTAAYIDKYKDIYNNPNYTTWAQAGQKFPMNEMTHPGCKPRDDE